MSFLPGRELELAPEIADRFIDAEAWADCGHLQQHAAGLAEVNRMEVLPVEHRGDSQSQVNQLAAKTGEPMSWDAHGQTELKITSLWGEGQSEPTIANALAAKNDPMSRLERELIHRALKQTQGNVTHAARLLKISRKGLQLKMKELNLREREPE